MSDKIKKVTSELTGYLDFPPRWDGYEGKTFNVPFISRLCVYVEWINSMCGEFIDDITSGPASDGSVDIELLIKNKQLIITCYYNEKPTFFLMNEHKKLDGYLPDIVKSLCSV